MTPGVSVYSCQSIEITSLADRNVSIGKKELSTSLEYIPSPMEFQKNTENNSDATLSAAVTSVQSSKSIDQKSINSAVAQFISNQSPRLTDSVISPNKSIDKDIDKALLFYVSICLSHGKLSEDEKRASRESFRVQISNS